MARFTKNRFDSEISERETPQEFFDRLNNEFNFTLDPCATPENAKCEKFFTKEDNGLLQDWSNHIVYCNPPFGRETKKWVKKAYYESKKDALIVLLVLAKTNTLWWHNYCMQANEIRFIKGRPKFKGMKYGLPWPLALIIFKPGFAILIPSEFEQFRPCKP